MTIPELQTIHQVAVSNLSVWLFGLLMSRSEMWMFYGFVPPLRQNTRHLRTTSGCINAFFFFFLSFCWHFIDQWTNRAIEETIKTLVDKWKQSLVAALDNSQHGVVWSKAGAPSGSVLKGKIHQQCNKSRDFNLFSWCDVKCKVKQKIRLW